MILRSTVWTHLYRCGSEPRWRPTKPAWFRLEHYKTPWDHDWPKGQKGRIHAYWLYFAKRWCFTWGYVEHTEGAR